MNILLSGPPFSGKTTISQVIADQLNWKMVNIDTLLEEKYQMSCPEQYKKFGDQQFRLNETLLLKDLKANPKQSVISLGGGTLTHETNAQLAKELGLIVCLQCTFDVLLERLILSKRVPSYLDPNDLEGSFKTLLEKRNEHYKRYGDYFIDVSNLSPKVAATNIINEYKRRYGN